MKTILLHLALICIFPILFFSCSQQIFQTEYDSGTYDASIGLTEANNNDLIVAGVNLGSSTFLLRTDRNGNKIWEKNYLRNPNETVSAVLNTVNQDIIVLGSWKLNNDIYIQKFSSNGNLIWAKSYTSSTGILLAKHIIETNDNGYIITGSNFSTEDIFILKLDATGNVQWAKSYADGISTQGASITQLTNGNYAVVSEWYQSEVIVLMLDSSGNIIWGKTISDDTALNYEGRDVISDANNIIVSGVSAGKGVLVKMDNNGIVNWAKKYEISGSQHDFNVSKNRNGNYTVLGSNEQSASSNGVFLMEVSSGTGNPNWLKKYATNSILFHPSLNNSFSNMSPVQAYDGGYVFTSVKNNLSDIYIVRTNEQGNTPCLQTSYIPSANDFIYEETTVSFPVTNHTISFNNFTLTPVNQTFTKNIICEQVGCVTPPNSLTAWYPFDLSGTDLVSANNAIEGSGASPTFPVGVVFTASKFDGIDDYFTIPSSPSTNFGTGDFSIDFWIKADAIHSTGTAIVIDKLDITGYRVYLDNGVITLTLNDGFSTTFNSTYNVADGAWHFVAISINRNNTFGGRWIIDGNLITFFNPTAQDHTVSNNSAVLIGRGTSNSNPYFFKGEIDELEFFNEAVPTSKFQEIYSAGKYGNTGKCKTLLNLPEFTVLCSGDTQASVNLSVCNYNSSTQTYNIDEINGFPASLGCDVNGPTTYNVTTTMPISINPGDCGTIQILIDRPTDLIAPYDKACYEVSVIDNNGILSWAQVKLIDLSSSCLTLSSIGNDKSIEAPTKQLKFILENTSNSIDTIQYKIGVRKDNHENSKNMIVKMMNKEDVVILSPGQQQAISFELEILEKNPFSENIIYFKRLDAKSGLYEPIYSYYVK